MSNLENTPFLLPYKNKNSNLVLLTVANSGSIINLNQIFFNGGGFFRYVENFLTESGKGNISLSGSTTSTSNIYSFSLLNSGSSSQILWDPVIGFNPFNVQKDSAGNETVEGIKNNAVSQSDYTMWIIIAVVVGVALIVIIGVLVKFSSPIKEKLFPFSE